LAQKKPQAAPPAPAPAKPYKPVAIAPPAPAKDAALDTFRGKVGDAAQKKDRAALGPLVVNAGFFWDRESGKGADAKKSGADVLATALGLKNKDAPGWDILASYAEEPSVSATPRHPGAMCAPADPGFVGKDFNALLDSTATDPADWAYPISDGLEVRSAAGTTGPVMEKLGLHFVRVIQDMTPAPGSASSVKIVTPSGKTGFVAADSIAPIGNDQLCYVKDGGAWKIGGFIGAGDAQ